MNTSADLSPTKLHNHFHGACPNRDRPLLLTRWRVAGLALESYLDSNQGGMPPMTPSRVSGSLTRSSSHSGIFFQGDGQSQNIVNSHLSSSFVNSSSTVPGAGCSNLGPVSGDINNAVLNTVTNSAPSVGASSLVTDANSALSSGPHLQRSASSSHQDQNVQQLQQNQQQPQGASSATSLPASQTRPSLLQMGAQVPRSFIQDPNNMSHLSKKPRMDIKQEDIMQQQVIQQILQRQDSMQFQGRNPQLQAFLQQQQRLRQQQIFQSMPQLQRAHLQQQR
ncbi:hypothetical protein JHK85_025787 [Glycine max]|nr:hypothetical protein JHK85_025787 [Glycine max]